MVAVEPGCCAVPNYAIYPAPIILRAGTKTALKSCHADGGIHMPLWLELLINVIGYGGFIAIAMYHKSDEDERSDQI
jgi:hypothetical protein